MKLFMKTQRLINSQHTGFKNKTCAFDDNVSSQKTVYDIFKQNYETREKITEENSSYHGIPQVDPQSLEFLYINGNKYS
jgi:hypothetical protein